MAKAYLNCIETAVPPNEIHQDFIRFAPALLNDRSQILPFKRMAFRAQIEHRYSFLKPPLNDNLDEFGFYRPGAFPDTAKRMALYQQYALQLAGQALNKLALNQEITHLIVTSCTGFYAPGLDLEIVERYDLNPAVERTIIGFMGCHAALHGLKFARHIVRSAPNAKVLMLNIELCTLHLKQPYGIEELLSFVLFGDGCAASLISAEPAGFELQSFSASTVPETNKHMTWTIGRTGFEMFLSGKIPALIKANLPAFLEKFIAKNRADIRHWAIHPGGRSVLDAVQGASGLSKAQMRPSREILAAYGNMSSPTIMFVLKRIMEEPSNTGKGCAIAFGPGLSIEALQFELTRGNNGKS